MRQYLELLRYVREQGKDRPDRTGVGTRGVFGYQMRLGLADGFPLLTTKAVHVKSVLHELLWMISGSANIRVLQAQKVRIWNEWADAEGNLGPVYGVQWRRWDGQLDQLKQLIAGLVADPYGRRHIVTAWNPSDVPAMKLPPCHCFWQCYVEPGEFGLLLSLHLYMRSADIFLGVPFNIASYAFLLYMLAHQTGYQAHELVISFGDLHLYRNHFAQADEQLSRVPGKLPQVGLCLAESIDHYTYEHFEVTGYEPLPAIKAPIAV